MNVAGSWLKIKRAKKHIRELNSTLESFIDNFDGPIAEIDKNTGQLLLHYPLDPLFPQNISAIVGDVIHNLRTALDLVWCDLYRGLGVEITSNTKFPIRESRKAVEDAIHGIEKVWDRRVLRDIILDDIKPYPGGDDSLWPLHQLDILDKHQIILPIFDSVVFTLYIEDENGGFYEAMVIKTRGRELTSRYGVGHTFKGKRHSEVQVFFDVRTPVMGGEPIRLTLARFTSRVESIVRFFESLNL